MAARTEHAHGFANEGGHVEVRNQVEGLVVVGQISGIGDAEGDPALGVQADLGGCGADHRLGDVDSPHARLRKLARDQQRPLAGSGADLERALRRGLDVQEGARKRCEVIRRARARTVVPARGRAIEETAHRPADRRPNPGRPDDEAVQDPAYDPDPLRRRPARGLIRTRERARERSGSWGHLAGRATRWSSLRWNAEDPDRAVLGDAARHEPLGGRADGVRERRLLDLGFPARRVSAGAEAEAGAGQAQAAHGASCPKRQTGCARVHELRQLHHRARRLEPGRRP